MPWNVSGSVQLGHEQRLINVSTAATKEVDVDVPPKLMNGERSVYQVGVAGNPSDYVLEATGSNPSQNTIWKVIN